jgi:CBS domain-containing membrane protein
MTSLGRQLVSTLMRRDFIHMGPEESLLEADRIMRLARIRHLPVIERGRLVGILSHRDVLYASVSRLEKRDAAARLDHLRGIAISGVMQRNVATIEPDDSLADAARRMLSKKIGCLVVVSRVDGGAEVIALLTESDLLRAAFAPEFREASD